ncbi:hypothetical protein BN7_323 [Wickerhamomyces ciferrii]|uniref:F-box domain-containing protein n=1 Tax=Wickerhamomyces ciferrii (strain ATCC 14091 / BCRC 22168 / CBS 111 / JCM 3599 / NBRC 0793 / NRRL Y-1031 F-60-10) TaxID=1206466 RepID=K0KHG8_WICCF|nr:uncharacterized protein BN7_323 [Wickerhamomyces ciferrii]CCH40789.1 hypothetical protein BN7_323 [Wickerhamomyces ciferrii]
MSSPFSCLPNEVLVLILRRLSPADINNLFAIGSIAQRLKQFIRLIKDSSQTRYFHNVPSELDYKISGNIAIPSIGLLQLFEISDICLFMDKMTHVQNEVSKVVVFLNQDFAIDIFGNGDYDSEYRAQKMYARVLREYACRGPKLFDQLCFSAFEFFEEIGLVFDPATFHIPKVKKLILSDCENINDSVMFDCKELEHLDISGPGFNSFSKSLNFEFLKALELSDVGDINLHRVLFKHLEHFTIKNRPRPYSSSPSNSVVKISWCIFPKMRHIVFEASNKLEIDKLATLNLLTMKINSDEQLVFKNTKLPKVEYIELTSKKFPIIENVDSQSLKHVYLDINDAGSSSADHGFFKQSPSLWVNKYPIEFLQNIGSNASFEYFGTVLREEDKAKLGAMSPLNAKCIELKLIGDQFESIPKLKAPLLKSLKVNCSALKTLDNMKIDYPNLEELSLKCSGIPLNIIGWIHPNLKRLQIDATNQPLQFIGSLENLEAFTVTRDWESLRSDPDEIRVSIDISAPKLITYVMDRVKLRFLNVLNFPNLQLLSIDKVDNLIGGDLKSLIRLDLIGSNMNLLKLRAPNLEVLELFNTRIKTRKLDSGLGLSPQAKRERFGSDYNPELEKIETFPNLYTETYLDKISENIPLKEDEGDGSHFETYVSNGKFKKRDFSNPSYSDDENLM